MRAHVARFREGASRSTVRCASTEPAKPHCRDTTHAPTRTAGNGPAPANGSRMLDCRNAACRPDDGTARHENPEFPRARRSPADLADLPGRPSPRAIPATGSVRSQRLPRAGSSAKTVRRATFQLAGARPEGSPEPAPELGRKGPAPATARPHQAASREAGTPWLVPACQLSDLIRTSFFCPP